MRPSLEEMFIDSVPVLALARGRLLLKIPCTNSMSRPRRDSFVDPGKAASQSHEIAAQSGHHLQPADLADPRRRGEARRHRACSDDPASLRDVLAAVAVCRFRSIRNVGLL